jgi:hypothetical protein
MTPAPNKERWEALRPLRQQLNQRFLLWYSKRMMLEILWQQIEGAALVQILFEPVVLE